MQNEAIKYVRLALNSILIFAMGAGLLLTSCKDQEEDEAGVQVELLSFGPMPVARGGELRFIGNNLDKVTAIVIPDNIVIQKAQFTLVSPTLLKVTVPQEAIEGIVTLRTPAGDIQTRTRMGYSEPISVATFSPATIKPGSELTISGAYLNLVGEVIFTDRVVVDSTRFISQSRGEIKLIVPFEAQSGIIAVSNGRPDPIIVYSENQVEITLPRLVSISPNPVKAGTNLTIAGTNLDLVTAVILNPGGGANERQVLRANFISRSGTEIVVRVPDDNRDGRVQVVAASGQGSISENILTMMVPTEVVANPASLKNGEAITFTGVNMDLVSSVVFAGNVVGEITASTATSISVTTPTTAISGAVRLLTRAGKEVAGGNIAFINPSITSFAPVGIKPNQTLVITGTNLDLVNNVTFAGNINGAIISTAPTQLEVRVPVGARSGPFTIVAVNGTSISSPTQLEVLSNLPEISGFLQPRGEPGRILTIQGSNLMLIKTIIFPGNIHAIGYGRKNDSMVEVFVPTNVPIGSGNIRIITFEGEEGLLPSLFFGSVDPVLNPAHVFFDFNGTGKDSWWGNAMGSGPETNPATSADGSPYWRINGMSGTGFWDGLFFRNSSNNFDATGVNVNTWAVRFDLNTFEPFPTEGSIRVRLGGGGDTHFFHFNLNQEMGFANTNGWITVTLPLSRFLHESNATPIPSAATGGSEFGMIWSSGTSVRVNLGIDNVRFEPIP